MAGRYGSFFTRFGQHGTISYQILAIRPSVGDRPGSIFKALTTVYALLTLARNRFGFYLSLVPFRKYLNTHNIPFDQSSFLEDNYLYMAQRITGREDIIEDIRPPVLAVREKELCKPYIILNNTCSKLASVRKLPGSYLFGNICQWILEHTSYDMALHRGNIGRQGR